MARPLDDSNIYYIYDTILMLPAASAPHYRQPALILYTSAATPFRPFHAFLPRHQFSPRLYLSYWLVAFAASSLSPRHFILYWLQCRTQLPALPAPRRIVTPAHLAESCWHEMLQRRDFALYSSRSSREFDTLIRPTPAECEPTGVSEPGRKRAFLRLITATGGHSHRLSPRVLSREEFDGQAVAVTPSTRHFRQNITAYRMRLSMAMI